MTSKHLDKSLSGWMLCGRRNCILRACPLCTCDSHAPVDVGRAQQRTSGAEPRIVYCEWQLRHRAKWSSASTFLRDAREGSSCCAYSGSCSQCGSDSCAGTAAAQSQAVNGTIEGTVRDSSGASLPGVTVTVTNIDTGDDRVRGHQRDGRLSRAAASARALQVSAELQGFKKFEQQGITLSAGQTAVDQRRRSASAT